ncbi:EF-hand domain-containing protein [Phenylobacterium sp.]|uniref:EF-hand domain-containing protein n=1 Tax=Phenylobacterium sp. TaxID=1871053 RepID=UPI0025D2BE43|nr:EF-hand domain-containing protein [Phenylobacterium sp.]
MNMLLQPQQTAAGQDLPGADSTTPATPAPATAQTTTLSSAQFASDTLSSLLTAQEGPPTASSIASQIMSVADTNGDGSLSLSEIETAIGADSASGTNTTSGSDTASGSNALTQAFNAIDTNGDGEISASELTDALSAQNAAQNGAQGAQAAHHHHHHGGGGGGGGGGTSGAGGASSTDLASQILGTADTNGDGELSMTEIENALGVTSTSSTAVSNTLTSAFNSLDTNGDGQLSASELSAGIDAFRAAHHRGGAETAQPQAQTQSTVTA